MSKPAELSWDKPKWRRNLIGASELSLVGGFDTTIYSETHRDQLIRSMMRSPPAPITCPAGSSLEDYFAKQLAHLMANDDNC